MRSLALTVLLACGPSGSDPGDDGLGPDGDVDTDTDTEFVDTDTAPPTEFPEVAANSVVVTILPQVATVVSVGWQQRLASDAVWLSWTVDGVEHSSPPGPRAIGAARELILGVPSETPVDLITIHATVDGTEYLADGGSITTGPLPADLSDPPELVTTASPIRPEPFLLTSVDVGSEPFFGPCYTIVLDADGRIVWYRPTPGTRLTWQPSVSRSGGSVLIDESTTYAFNDPNPPTVTRLTLDLAQTETYELPDMMVAYGELDDGSLVYDERESNEAFHLTRLYPNGTTERIWSCNPWMSLYSDQYWACATNTTLWNPTRGTVLWSTFETNIVVEIDLATGIIANEYGPFPGGYAFDPPNAAFDKQHSPNWTASGTLIASTHTVGGARQVAREFEVDPVTSTLRQIWEVETPDYAEYGGQIQALPSGNRMWQLGTAGVIQEITPDGQIVWRVAWPNHLVGNTTPLADLYPLLAGW